MNRLRFDCSAWVILGLALGVGACSKAPQFDPNALVAKVSDPNGSPTPSSSPKGSPSPTPPPSPSPVSLGDIKMYPTYRDDKVVSSFPVPLTRIRSGSYSICGLLADQVVCKGEFYIFGSSGTQDTGKWISVLEGVPSSATLLMDSAQRVAAVSGNTLYYRGNPCAGFPELGVYSPGKAFPTGAKFVFPDTIRRAEMNHMGTVAVLLNNGSLYFFGDNRFQYQIPLSTASTCVSNPVKLTDKDVAGSKIKDVALNAEGGLVLSEKGELYSWGSNRSGQVGNNRIGNPNAVPFDTSVSVSKPIPIPFPGGTPAKVISTQGYNAIAIDTLGRLYMIGFDYSGQSCNGAAGAYYAFNATPTFTPPQGTIIQALAAGGNHTMLLTKNPTSGANVLYACGGNVSGMLGNGTLTGSTSLKAVPLPGVASSVLEVSVAERNTYLLLGPAGGAVLYSAGNNHKAQITSPLSYEPMPSWTPVQPGW